MDDSLQVRVPRRLPWNRVAHLVAAERTRDVAAGQPLDFATFYEATMPRLYAYLRTRSADDEAAADLTQQAYLQALRAWDRRPTGEDGWAPWLFRIGRNAATDAYRKRHDTVEWDSLPEALQPIAGDSAEAQAVHRETLAQVRDLVAALPPRKREILALRFAADLTYREIGVLQGRREAAVKKEMSRLLDHLRRQR
jgi:RNA polymerase sigma-70 factor (ECF subfamily)